MKKKNFQGSIRKKKTASRFNAEELFSEKQYA